MKDNKVDKVYALERGTAIDHIPRGKALKVVEILGVHSEGIVTIGMNFDSKKMGKKDVVKIENKKLTPQEYNKIGLIAPTATINIIHGFERVEKFKIELPKVFDNIVKCKNPNCITNHQDVSTKFYLMCKSPIKIRCNYCERIFNADEIEML